MIEAMAFAGTDGHLWQCTVGQPKVRIRGPQDLKGVCVEAVADAEVDETLLAEDTREDRLVALLTRRWIPVLCAFADAPKDTQEAVLSLQSDFEIPECGMALATDRVATALSLCGVCSGTIPKSISRSKLSRERMQEVLNVMVINAADTLPDGGEAVFCIGALFEHSCEPNACFYLSSGDASLAARLGLKTSAKRIWIGEWRATRPVRSGEAVTVSYLEAEMLKRPVDQRRQILGARMGFHCLCTRCVRESPVPAKREPAATVRPAEPLNLAAMD